MSDSLSPTLIALCGNGTNISKLISVFDDMAAIEVGDHLKHSQCYASRELLIDQEVVEEFPFLEPYLGAYLYQDGTHDYSWGWDSFDNIVLQVVQLEEHPIGKDFNALMSHLNSEDDELAKEFKAKWCKPCHSRVEV